MITSGRSLRRRRIAVRWIARVAGGALFLLQIQQGAYEASHLVTDNKWLYADRMFSIGFLAMALGLLVGWLSDRAGAVLLVGGYMLAAGAPLLGTTARPMIGDDAAAVAIALLSFLAVGIAYAYAGRTMEPPA
jgi:MFS family permease